MADATDSKSVMGNHVWVRAPSPVLTKNQSYITVRLVFYSSVIIPVYLCHVAFSGGSQGLAGTMDGAAAAVVGGTGKVYVSIEFFEFVGEDMRAAHDILLRVGRVCDSV